MTGRELVSVVYWFGFWFGLAFGVPELMGALWKSSPIMTLSSTTKDVERAWVWFAFLIGLGLTILNVHLVGPFLRALWKEIVG